jgi:HEAT repeat protein
MNKDKPIDADLKKMIADYMENGFLENIIDMFRHDSQLYTHIGGLMQDERIRVRMGITALMEELKKVDEKNVSKAIPNIIPLLENEESVIRGDAVNLLGIIGNNKSMPFLKKALSDKDPAVKQIAQEAIEEINLNLLE